MLSYPQRWATARRLAMEADKIAQILNDDFRKISDRLASPPLLINRTV